MTSSDDDAIAWTDRGQRSLRWAIARLVVLWSPIAAVSALALWMFLDAHYEPWDWRNNLVPALEVLPSQLLFAVLLVIAGRFETAPRRKAQPSRASLNDYWKTSALLVGGGFLALWFLALSQPVLQ